MHVFTIPPQFSFVDALARGIWERADKNPAKLAEMRILLPSRRVTRALRESFLRLTAGQPLILPKMQPLGEIDEEELAFYNDEVLNLPPAIAPQRRLMLMARLIHQLHRTQYGEDARLEQAMHLARQLVALFDDMARAGCALETLNGIVPQDLAEHWQVTLDFLHLVQHEWQRILTAHGRMDPVLRRNAVLHLYADHLQKHPPATPIIAAGSTGSQPATAQLLAAIASLPEGMIVLPGFDPAMDSAVWDNMEETHPAFGMKHLLLRMKMLPAQVRFWEETKHTSHSRVQWLEESLRPAATTDAWRASTLDAYTALDGCMRIDAASTQEEATIIALLLRESLQNPAKTAALITPDRQLARKVASILQRFHVVIDDSAGMPLASTAGGIILQLIADVAQSGIAPAPLLALLKHPLALLCMETGWCRRQAHKLEKLVLRGVRMASGFAPIRAVAEQKAAFLLPWLEKVEEALAPLVQQLQFPTASLHNLLSAHIAVAEKFVCDAAGNTTLWRGEAGEALARFLHDVRAHADTLPEIDTHAYAGIFGALLAGQSLRSHYGVHPRLHVLSPMEARQQQFDLVILAGLNEGTWPETASIDPWMSRPMRGSAGLPIPERQVGLSAHDFMMLASAPQVVMTRAEKENGTPSTPSRWLLRMDAVLGVVGGEVAVKHWRRDERKWRVWASALDKADSLQLIQAPAPCPPVLARPRQFSVTQIESLLRNPYAIYASKILALKKLEALDMEPSLADFGNIVHKAAEICFRKPVHEQTLESLLEAGKDAFADLLERPGIRAFWWPRFERIAAWLIEEHHRRMPSIHRLEVECSYTTSWTRPAGDFTLTAKMDRVEHLNAGGSYIIDYKTGTVPGKSEIQSGIACQMPLEGMILQDQNNLQIADMEYWALKGKGEKEAITLLSSMGTTEALIQQAREGVTALIARYDDPVISYPHCPNPAFAPRYNDYEHLSRAREWGGVLAKGKLS